MTAWRLLRAFLPDPLWKWAVRHRDRAASAILARSALRRLRKAGQGAPHALSSELVVCLTSYPARFGTLYLTLACLLDQTVKPDRVILWLAHHDIGLLPREVSDLAKGGLEIRGCDDLRSFKKLIPALEAFPGAYIATADDDLHYRRDWLEELVDGADGEAITCHRAHRLKRADDGSIGPYREWEIDVQDSRARIPSEDILATSGAGALFPPGSLDARVTDRSLFQRLAGDGDDLWFYWCARLAGTRIRKVGGKFRLVMWKGSQEDSLWSVNEGGGNDRMIRRLEAELGKML